jgi:hypothetical protein
MEVLFGAFLAQNAPAVKTRMRLFCSVFKPPNANFLRNLPLNSPHRPPAVSTCFAARCLSKGGFLDRLGGQEKAAPQWARQRLKGFSSHGGN